jgi:hypothetical protein
LRAEKNRLPYAALAEEEVVGAALASPRDGRLLTTHHDDIRLFACCEVVGCSALVIIGDGS